jgi:catechol 2,3-dioxygenase-like lactoylglutathione lyase family enzyme
MRGGIMKQINTDLLKTLALPQVRQIGIVVEDLPKTAQFYSKLYGIRPWFRSKFTDEQHYLSGKRPIHFDLDIALAFAGKVQYEIIEHKGGDRNIYVDHLEKHGEGVHHLGFYVDDFDERLASCRNCGIKVLQSGVLKSGGNLGGSTTKYAYLDTTQTGGVIFELIETSAMGMKIKPSRPWFELGAAMGDLEKMRV